MKDHSENITALQSLEDGMASPFMIGGINTVKVAVLSSTISRSNFIPMHRNNLKMCMEWKHKGI